VTLLKGKHFRYGLHNDFAIIQIGVENVGALKGLNSFRIVDGVKAINGEGISYAISGDSDYEIFDNITIGDDVYMFGYPVSIGDRSAPQFEYDKPLLRKGAIAGKNALLKTIILDCPVYYGNSGSPVCQVELKVNHDKIVPTYRLIGVVTQLIPFFEITPKKLIFLKRPRIQMHNTGYAVVVPMDDILNLINKWNE